MKHLLTITLLFFAALAHGNDPSAIKAADDARIAAMKAGDKAQLEAIFSDELRYAHSNGVVDTKKSFIDILASGKTKYLLNEPAERTITFPAPGVALVSGRTQIKAVSEKGEMEATLSYLAVWREESGKWRFLAWQSCKLPPPDAK